MHVPSGDTASRGEGRGPRGRCPGAESVVGPSDVVRRGDEEPGRGRGRRTTPRARPGPAPARASSGTPGGRPLTSSAVGGPRRGGRSTSARSASRRSRAGQVEDGRLGRADRGWKFALDDAGRLRRRASSTSPTRRTRGARSVRTWSPRTATTSGCAAADDHDPRAVPPPEDLPVRPRPADGSVRPREVHDGAGPRRSPRGRRRAPPRRAPARAGSRRRAARRVAGSRGARGGGRLRRRPGRPGPASAAWASSASGARRSR